MICLGGVLFLAFVFFYNSYDLRNSYLEKLRIRLNIND